MTLFLFGILFGAIFFVRKKRANSKLLQELARPKTTFWLLIGWTIFGFLTNLDFTEQWGCIISHEPIFSKPNILYSGLALLVLSIGFFVPFRQVRYVVLIGELFFWTFKLMTIKGGYAVGFGGVPSVSVLSFDIIALTLRLLLIKQIVPFKFNSIYLLIPAFITLSIKTNFFPTQQSIITEFEEYPKELEKKKTQLNGIWTGISKTEITITDTVKYDTLLFNLVEKNVVQFDTVIISIDSNYLRVEGIEKFRDESYLVQFMTISDVNLWNVLPDSITGDIDLMENLGTNLKINTGIQNTNLQIWKLSKDTMICNLDYKYEMTLKRKK